MISEDTIRRVKDAASIVDVMSDFHDLRRDGVGYTCLCPFHQDRHLGSFKISPKRNIYTCFSCGEHGGPVDYLMKARGLSFAESIAYLGKKYGISVEGADKFDVKPSKPHQPPPPLPTLELPLTMVAARKSTDNTLCHWLRALPWDEEQRRRVPIILENYGIGTSKEGHAIFWQIDETAKVRTGKMMLYKPDGHRDKETPGNFGWIHSRLMRARWYDPEQVEMRQTLFGMHLLDVFPRATVNIVESEKTAIVCAICYGGLDKNIWMATGGMHNLTREKLLPIIKRGRPIILYPDRDGVEQWRERLKAIGYKHSDINTQMLRKVLRPEDGPKADMADAIVRVISSRQPTTHVDGRCTALSPQHRLDNLCKENPHMATLVERLDLEAVSDDAEPF